ncbi:MAG: hypothetical protein WDM92_04385 [Caulobacteraceae bacterium]
MKRIREAHREADITLLTTPEFEALAKSSRYFNTVIPDGEPKDVGDTLSVIGWMRRARFERIYDCRTPRAPTSISRL